MRDYNVPIGLGLLMVLAGAILLILQAFGVGDNESVHLGWLGAAIAVVGLKIP